MAAINITFDKNLDIDIVGRIILFKLRGNIVEEYLVPNGYDVRTNNNSIVIGQKKPSQIPIGYDSLESAINGLWHIFSTQDFETTNGQKYYKELFFMDTSTIDKLFFQTLAEKFGIFDAKVPDSFWFSSQYRDITEGWTDLKGAIEYAKNFDVINESRLIHQTQLLAIFYDQLYLYELMKNQLSANNGKIIKQVDMIHLENWDFPVIFSEKTYYKMSWWDDSRKYQFIMDYLKVENNQKEPLFSIPVIDQKVKIK